MRHPVRLELTREGLLVKLANRFITLGTQLHVFIWFLMRPECDTRSV